MGIHNFNRMLVLKARGRSPLNPPYPITCQLCSHMIESADDTFWHGYGNCVEITPEMEEQWEREARDSSTK